MSKIAVLVPCYNEELTVEKVVNDFKHELPEADIYVYDNNSKDKTVELAIKAGALIGKETRQGKGNVVRTMFKDIEADVYVLVDGDDTYPADEVHKLIDPVINNRVDMVIGDRLSNGTYTQENKRGFHNFGNNLVKGLINKLFKSNIKDIMTGYRVFSRRLVKNMPVMSAGFQIETEMTIFSLVHRMKIEEVAILYRDRPEGSESKLNTVQDGMKVLLTLFNLFKNYRPMLFFTMVSIVFMILGLIIGAPVIMEFALTNYVSKVPSAILAAGLFIIAFVVFLIGVILDAIKNQTCFQFEVMLNQYENNENNKK